MSSTQLPSDIEPLKAADIFRSQRDVLAGQLQHNLTSVANKLYTRDIIPKSTISKAMIQAIDQFDRTVCLLDVVEDKIKVEPQVFTKFVEILELELTLKSLASKLVKKYGKRDELTMLSLYN